MSNFEKRSGYFDKNLNLVEASREFLSYFESSSLHCDHILDFVIDESKDDFKKAADSANSDQLFLFKMKRNNGYYAYNLVCFENFKNNGLDLVKIKTTDVDELIEMSEYRAVEDLRLKKALSLTNEYIFSYDKSSNLFSVFEYSQNRRVTIFEQDLDDWKQQMLNDGLIPENQMESFDVLIEDIKDCPASFTSKLTCGIRTGSSEILEKIRFMGVRFVDGDKVAVVGRILTEERMRESNVSKNILGELQIDSLTQVYNKKTITQFAKHRIKENTNDHVALIIVDLDHFKSANDQYGHLAGDQVLVKAGQILKEIVGDDGYVGRFGGDEFMLIVNGVDNDEILRGVLRAILTNVRKAFEDFFEDIKITASIGAAVHPDNAIEYEELFKKADFCLYRAKDKGRDRYIFYREDLHKAEFEKSDANKTAGIKYDGREMQEISYISQFIRELDRFPDKAIKNVLDHMIETYNLDSVSIFYGEQMRRIYHKGKVDNGFTEATYVYDNDFKLLLKENDYVRLDFWTDLSDQNNTFLQAMKKRGIQSTLHCILGTPDNIKGIVCFDRIKMGQLFAEYEVNCCNIFSSCLNLQKQKIIIQILEGL